MDNLIRLHLRPLLPSPRAVEHEADEEGRKARQGVAQPEAVVLHVQDQTEQHGQADPHDNAIQDGGGEVDAVVAASVEEGVHHGAEGRAHEHEHRDGEVAVHQGQHVGVALGGEDREDGLGEEKDGRRQEDGDRQGDDRNGAHDPLDPLEFSRGEILPHHGGARHVHGLGDEVGDPRDLVGDAREGGDRHAVAVDEGVDEEL